MPNRPFVGAWVTGHSRTPAPTPARRPWTRVGTVGACAHIFYELGAGVGMPFASLIGPGPAAAVFGGGGVLAFREAGRQPRSRDTAFAMLNGFFLSAVLAHFSGWPQSSAAKLRWLTECEGLSGRLMPPYNLLLYMSGVAAVGGLVETGRGRGRQAVVPAVLVPAAIVPWLVGEQHRDHARLRDQARRRPGWWNRRRR
jgi:hypothetical protein